MRIHASTTLFAASLVAFAAHAEPFVGGNLGTANYGSDACFRSSSCDKNDSAWSVRAGYALPFLSIEARYFNLGRARSEIAGGTTTSANGTMTPFNISTELKASGVGAGVQAAVPIAPFSALTALAGVARVRARQDIPDVTVGAGTLVGISFSKTSTQPYYGIGARFTFVPGLDFSLDAQRYRADFGGGKSDVDFYGVGLTYRF